MSDESIVNLSDTTKATMRNYAMVAGFMVIFIIAAINASIYFTGKIPSAALGQTNFIFLCFLTGISLMVIGSALAFLHKRDLVAITFILMAIMLLITPIMYLLFDGPHIMTRMPVIVVLIIVGVAMLFTRNEQKYVCGLVLLPYSILALIYGLHSDANIYIAACTVQAVVSLYSALCIGLENPKFPGYRILTADEEDEEKDGSPVHFRYSGFILGIALMMIPAVCAVCGYFDVLSIHGVDGAQVKGCGVSCGLMLIFVGFLMLTAGRMTFMPFIYMMIGIAMALQTIVGLGWLLFVFLLVVGLMCLFRTEKRILVGIPAILLGLIYLIGPGGIGTFVELGIALSAILVVILSYVCFALCSDDRLKLF